METLELISFKLCPFVQRAVITLHHKNLPFTLTHIDLDHPPAWFHSISPFGKVPLLKVGERAVLFESAVIAEYLDETTAPRLHPQDPLRRALNRAWIEFGSAALGDLFQLTAAKTAEAFAAQHQHLLAKLRRLEGEIAGPFFNGADFSLVDAAYAPLLIRLELLNQAHPLFEADEFPRLEAWHDALLAVAAVKASVVPDFVRLYLDHIRARGGHLATLLPAA